MSTMRSQDLVMGGADRTDRPSDSVRTSPTAALPTRSRQERRDLAMIVLAQRRGHAKRRLARP